ncbi:hypothetical protein ACU686_21650 [Yinghuangia aomiensis]
MSYAPPPGPHGGIPGQRQWGAAPSPQAYRGPARPRKFLVIVVGLLVSAAALAGIAATVLVGQHQPADGLHRHEHHEGPVARPARARRRPAAVPGRAVRGGRS